MTRLAMLLTVLGMFTATSAMAAPPADSPPQKRKLDFEGDTISADFLKPGTMLIEGVSRGRRSSLIEVRLDFVSEILRSADDI